MDRRNLITRTVQAIGAITASAIAVPTLISGLSPVFRHRPDEENWQVIGEAASFPVGDVVRTTVPTKLDSPLARLGKAVFVWRNAEDEFTVYSPSCTDLGCPITWDSGSQWFYCPCHGGIFSKEGEPKAGPPKDPLHRYEVRIRNGQVEIDLASLPPQI